MIIWQQLGSRLTGSAVSFCPGVACHQQYLAKNPNGYCGLGGTGVSCPVGLFTSGSSSEVGHA